MEDEMEVDVVVRIDFGNGRKGCKLRWIGGCRGWKSDRGFD